MGVATSDWGRTANRQWDIPGGAAWARLWTPLRAVEANTGWDVRIGHQIAARQRGPGTGRLSILTQHGQPLMLDPDIVVIQRLMTRGADEMIRAARQAGQVVIQDVDDWFWGLDPRNQAYRATDPVVFPDRNRNHYAKALAASSLVTVSTPFLGKRIRERFGVETALLRNSVDLAMYAPQPVRDTTRALVVGWTGALAVRSGDLETLRGILGPYLASMDGTFVHHGVHPRDTTTAADLMYLTGEQAGPTRPLCVPEDYPDMLQGFDIGIVPLSQVEFNTGGKSFLKGLEYSAAGIPFVAQWTPEYEQLGAGLLAKNGDQWRNHLETLTDPVRRREVRERGLRVAREQSISARWSEWSTVYEKALAQV